ncbi:MAG: NAD(P)H-dependent oxidoreductase [Burkholderiaceae bacterium]
MNRILCFAASTRTASLNKKLARAAAVAAEMQGAHARVLDLRDHPMPIYDGDLEQVEGVPAAAAELATEIAAHDALIIASPEYNGGPPALLKNTFDWITRLREADGVIDGRATLAMKPTLLISASPGALGGMRGSVLTRAMLTHLGLWLLPQTVAVGNAGEAFSADGALPADKEKQLNLALRALLRASRA